MDQFTVESIFKIFAGILCGFLLGIERKSHNHAIGMRTLALICVSSTLLSILSSYMATNEIFAPIGRGDPTRIAAGVISGIGFLGGGAIMKQGFNIMGLTSAAVIWTAAALGLSIGAGLYIQVAVALVLILFFLVYLDKLQTKFMPQKKIKTIHLYFDEDDIDREKIERILESSGIVIDNLNLSRMAATHQIMYHYLVKAPKNINFKTIFEELQQIGKIAEFSVTD